MPMRRAQLIAIATLFAGAACGDDATMPHEPLPIVSLTSSANEAQRADGAAATQPASPRKLVRNVDLYLVVSDIDKSMRQLDTLVATSGSLIVSSNASNGDEGRRLRIVLRVPANKLDNTLAEIRKFGKVSSEASSTDDITKAYGDLETRLAVKEQSLARLRAMLDTKPSKLSDVLDLEREISRTLSEVEQMKGERRYYDNEVAMSLVTVSFNDREFSATGTFSAPIRRAVAAGRATLGNSIAAVVYLSIFILPWLLIGIPIWRVLRRRKRGS